MKIQAILCLWAIAGYFVLPMLPSARGRANALMQAIIGGPIAWFYILFRGAWELWVILSGRYSQARKGSRRERVGHTND